MQNYIDKFSEIEDMPYICRKIDNNWSVGCGDTIFWNAVKLGDKIIPYLISNLDDTTDTKAYVPNLSGNYTIADVSFFALQILVWNIPILELAEDTDKPESKNGFLSYWEYTRRSFENRIKFKTKMTEWFENHKNQLKWIESDKINGCDCGEFINPANGHFELIEYNAVFIGTVKKIEKLDLKGKKAQITFKVDTILQIDNVTQFDDRIRLNKPRKKAILLEQPDNHKFEKGKKYKVFVGCCNVDYYYSIPELTKEL